LCFSLDTCNAPAGFGIPKYAWLMGKWRSWISSCDSVPARCLLGRARQFFRPPGSVAGRQRDGGIARRSFLCGSCSGGTHRHPSRTPRPQTKLIIVFAAGIHIGTIYTGLLFGNTRGSPGPPGSYRDNNAKGLHLPPTLQETQRLTQCQRFMCAARPVTNFP
jgi:hypothetical protein